MAEELINEAPTTPATVTKPARRSTLDIADGGAPGGLTFRKILISNLPQKTLIE
jgi:hypothetical protein